MGGWWGEGVEVGGGWGGTGGGFSLRLELRYPQPSLVDSTVHPRPLEPIVVYG